MNGGYKVPEWKNAERRGARLVNGRRLSRGSNFGVSGADIEHQWLSVEVKYRKKIPAYLDQWLAQAAKYAGASKLPLVLLMPKGRWAKNGIVIMRAGDFVEHFGGIKNLDKADK